MIECSAIESQPPRFILLVPEGLENQAELARRIHWMALRDHRAVLFLAMVDDRDHELSMLRWLVTLEAATRDGLVQVQSKVIDSKNWIQELRQTCRSVDQIICHEEQCARMDLAHTVPLNEFVQEKLHLPVEVISGFYHPDKESVKQWGRGLLFWLGAVLIVAVFALLQMDTEQALRQSNIARHALLIVELIIEVGLIWAWNGITG